jgi:hypothetical protein
VITKLIEDNDIKLNFCRKVVKNYTCHLNSIISYGTDFEESGINSLKKTLLRQFIKLKQKISLNMQHVIVDRIIKENKTKSDSIFLKISDVTNTLEKNCKIKFVILLLNCIEVENKKSKEKSINDYTIYLILKKLMENMKKSQNFQALFKFPKIINDLHNLGNIFKFKNNTLQNTIIPGNILFVICFFLFYFFF